MEPRRVEEGIVLYGGWLGLAQTPILLAVRDAGETFDGESRRFPAWEIAGPHCVRLNEEAAERGRNLPTPHRCIPAEGISVSNKRRQMGHFVHSDIHHLPLCCQLFPLDVTFSGRRQAVGEISLPRRPALLIG